VRIGVNTGEVVTNDTGTLATGDAVNVAARLEQAARPGEILVGESTRQLAESALQLGSVERVVAKGKSERLVAHPLLGVRADAPAFERRFDAPFIGRDGELEQLVQAYARAVRDRSCHLFTVLGPAGIGKSRLVYEFLDSHGEAIVLRGRCLAYGDGITYFPLVEILEQIAADADLRGALASDQQAREMLNTVTAAIGLTEEEVVAREDTFRAVRVLLETFARSRPLVLVLDDLHWAEPTLLDLVDHIADWSREAPILLLCLARPDLLDSRPGWAGGKLNATTILLEPLSAEEAEALIENLLVGVDLSDSLRGRILASAEGNPLFVEQMLALIAERGANGDDDIPVPPTIQALLATRLEQLLSVERVAAERASVIGKEFWATALAEIGGEVAALPGLVRKELIRPHRSLIFPADDAFRFRHQLIRDAAYDGMPKELRAELHERFGHWLETNRSEYEEIVGYHFEQAVTLREQLGRLDERADGLATDAGRLLGRAGHRAYEHGDTPAAINLLTRATGLLPNRDARRVEHLIELGYALADAGELQRSQQMFSDGAAAAAEAGESARESRARIGLLSVDVFTGSAFGTPFEGVEAEIAKLGQLQDDAGLAEGWYLAANLESWLGRSEQSGRSYDQAIEHARRCGNRRVARLSVGARAMLQAWGYMPAADGLRECNALLAEYAGTSVEPWLRKARAKHLSFFGDEDAWRAEDDTGQELFGQFGNELMRSAAGMSAADHEMRSGHLTEAESAVRDSVKRLERLGERGFLSSTIGILAEVLYRQGKLDEADDWARRAQDLAAKDDFDPQFRSCAVQARVIARRGDFTEAERLAREALAIAESTDWHMARGETAAALGEVLELAGREDEARSFYEQALVSFERKGSLPDIKTTKQRIADLA
jgi:tetratricopeptide (TPR) repeat protein